MLNLKNWPHPDLPEKSVWYFKEFTIRFDESDYCERSLQTQFISEHDAKTLEKAGNYIMRARFENNKLSRVEEFYGVEWTDRGLEPEEINFTYRPIPVHPVFQFEFQPKGLHQLGGIPPEHFVMPSHPDLPVSFQYIGSISKADPNFNWLPFDELHLVYPLFASIGPLFLDYSNSAEPIILNDFQFVGHTFKCVTQDTYIEFEQKRLGSRPLELDPEYDNTSLKRGIGWGGVANWIQYPEIPRCPKTGRVMRFLAQLETTDVRAEKKMNVGPEDQQTQHYLDTLNFWSDGELYVFFEPDSKVMCLLIQNT